MLQFSHTLGRRWHSQVQWKIRSTRVCLCCSYVINELIQTEKLYVDDLAQIVLVCIASHSITVRKCLPVNQDFRVFVSNCV